MKKRLLVILFIFLPFLLSAQQIDPLMQEVIRRDYVGELPTLAFMIIIFNVFITFAKIVLDHRLKRRLVDKGVSDTIIESILKPAPVDTKNQVIKWFIILAAASAGLFIVNSTLPLGIHSLAIMTGSLAVGFLAYFVFLKLTEK
jgi:hypothetical protein